MPYAYCNCEYVHNMNSPRCVALHKWGPQQEFYPARTFTWELHASPPSVQCDTNVLPNSWLFYYQYTLAAQYNTPVQPEHTISINIHTALIPYSTTYNTKRVDVTTDTIIGVAKFRRPISICPRQTICRIDECNVAHLFWHLNGKAEVCKFCCQELI